MVTEVAARRVRVGGRVLHLAERVDRVGAHREQRSGRAIVEVQVVVLRPLPLVDEQAQADVERLFAGATDPEKATMRFVGRLGASGEP